MGDSKTLDAATAGQPWTTLLRENINASSIEGVGVINLGVSSERVSNAVTSIGSKIGAVPSTYPVTAVILNWGVNDIRFESLVEATWKANYLTILDAIHAAWPDATVYLMRPWVRDYDAGCDTLATWIADIVAARPAFAVLGPDERSWLKGGDNGATMTSDGIHYSVAGRTECATQWQTVLGY